MSRRSIQCTSRTRGRQPGRARRAAGSCWCRRRVGSGAPDAEADPAGRAGSCVSREAPIRLARRRRRRRSRRRLQIAARRETRSSSKLASPPDCSPVWAPGAPRVLSCAADGRRHRSRATHATRRPPRRPPALAAGHAIASYATEASAIAAGLPLGCLRSTHSAKPTISRENESKSKANCNYNIQTKLVRLPNTMSYFLDST